MLRSLVPGSEKSRLPSTDRISGMFDKMEKEMRDLIGGFWGTDGGRLTHVDFIPNVDLVEKENEFVVTVDLPGLKPEEVKVELRNGSLWLTGERKEEKEEKNETVHRIERNHGEFRRVLPLPAPVKEDLINARFTDGVLKVSLPKAEDAKTRRIQVSS